MHKHTSPRSVTPRPDAVRHHVRNARADVLFQYLIAHGGSDLREITHDIVTNGDGSWTEARLERSIDDLVDEGRAEVDAALGYVRVSPLPPPESAA